jgi:hypothetical protein
MKVKSAKRKSDDGTASTSSGNRPLRIQGEATGDSQQQLDNSSLDSLDPYSLKVVAATLPRP